MVQGLPRAINHCLIRAAGLFVSAAILWLAAGPGIGHAAQVKHAKARKSSAVPRGMTIGIGNAPKCVTTGANPVPTLKHYRVKWFHEVMPTYANPTVAAQCLAAAAHAGYKVSVAIQYENWWSPSADAAWFKQVMAAIAPYVSQVSIGNEQELWTGGNPQKPAAYVKTWRAVEPIVRSAAPRALIGAGEISPWGEPFLKAAWRLGLPGAQIIAAHPYRKPGAFSIPELIRWAHTVKRSVWFTEALLNDRSWGVSIPAAKLAGATYAFTWLR